MEMVKFSLNSNDVPSKETIRRINEGYTLAEKNPSYDEENPPLTISELKKVISCVKKRA